MCLSESTKAEAVESALEYFYCELTQAMNKGQQLDPSQLGQEASSIKRSYFLVLIPPTTNHFDQNAQKLALLDNNLQNVQRFFCSCTLSYIANRMPQ